MRSLLKNQGRIGMFVAMATFVVVGACSQRAHKTTNPPAPTAEPPATVAPAEQPSSLPPTVPAPVVNGPARLDEVRLSETGGQRSVLFRFSRPPEGIDYFPLRSPNRLVVDIKGTMESPAKVQTYKTSDAVVSAVRIGTYQGKLRLIIDLKSTTPPQFSVDNYETLVTAFIGEKNANKSAAQSHAQILFLSKDARLALTSGAPGQPEKVTKTEIDTTAPSNTPILPTDSTQRFPK